MSKNPDGSITVPPGGSAIIGCTLGLGVIVVPGDDGRPFIAVDPAPQYAAEPACVALREHMEHVAVEWLRQVAPHRLSDAYRSGY